MSTIKASEVRKGMRVRVEAQQGGATVTSEGVVTKKGGEYTAVIWFGDHFITLHPDHPVTVLEEPKPNYVEGAWYRCQFSEAGPRLVRRVEDGWSPFFDGHAYWLDDHTDVTVLGRVLIVDWPGDDTARLIEMAFERPSKPRSGHFRTLKAVADAIRDQGGVP